MSRLEERLRIEADGMVVACSGKVEYGQGIHTAFAMLIAEELDVALGRVRVLLGDTAAVPWDMGTFGSLSVKTDGALLARAATLARRMLLDRAGHRWSLPAESLSTADGEVRAPDGRTATYAELVADEPLTGDIPEDLELKPPERRRVLGRPAEHREARGIVTGQAPYVADRRLPGMLRGSVLHPPVHGARLASLDDGAARAMPGVRAVVRDGDFVGVVAERAEVARAAAAALVPEWAPPAPAAGQERHLTLRSDGGVAEALTRGTVTFEAEYGVPYVANAPIGPSASAADVRADGAVIYAATQRPFGLRDQAAALLGLPPERVRVVAEMAAGSYGRNNAADAALEAVRLSRAVGRPVLVTWSRADEFHASPNRPTLRAKVRAALDAGGQIAAWASEITTSPHTYGGDGVLPDGVVAMTSGRNAVPPYRIPAVRVDLHVVPAQLRTGALRSLAAAPNVFAIESAVDELALRAGADPLDFRLRHVDAPRLARVLERVAERSGWARRMRAEGRGLGLACAVYHGTYVAVVAEVEVAEGGAAHLVRAWCAVDCGTVVNPDGARNQIEGAIAQAASWALLEELRYRDGRVLASSWEDYPVATFRDAPESIDVTFTDDGRTAPTGLGEPGVVPFAAAIANAVAAACGARVRELPLSPPRVRVARGR